MKSLGASSQNSQPPLVLPSATREETNHVQLRGLKITGDETKQKMGKREMYLKEISI